MLFCLVIQQIQQFKFQTDIRLPILKLCRLAKTRLDLCRTFHCRWRCRHISGCNNKQLMKPQSTASHSNVTSMKVRIRWNVSFAKHVTYRTKATSKVTCVWLRLTELLLINLEYIAFMLYFVLFLQNINIISNWHQLHHVMKMNHN